MWINTAGQTPVNLSHLVSFESLDRGNNGEIEFELTNSKRIVWVFTDKKVRDEKLSKLVVELRGISI